MTRAATWFSRRAVQRECEVRMSTTPIPLRLYVGTDRTLVFIWHSFISFLSISLHVVFIIGIRRLCGWSSNFSFTLLLINSVFCIVRFVIQFVAALTTLLGLDCTQCPHLCIAFGSLAFAPYYTIVILNILLTFHRLFYTAFPFKINQYLKKSMLQVIIATIFIFFLCFLTVLNTVLLGVTWNDLYIGWELVLTRNPELFLFLNSLSNYGIGCINLVVYSFLFALLFQRKLMSFKRNCELKMTLQVLCTVVCEILLFVYWQFCNVDRSKPWDRIIGETTNLLFFDITILPYLILNGNIHAQLKAIVKPNSVNPHLSCLRVVVQSKDTQLRQHQSKNVQSHNRTAVYNSSMAKI
ncbi:hypothetical protein Y032_0201g1742 [Ancylostoma ceylanicum]|uniref:Serpentine receptor class gamma n=1 Tax=Ancylostoma ceylanicum TaxID=53326 RepID=A0A016SN91_9BILA|nr:hypothetical protein Y032_0201g1742 [Ancylostoma ceylanicum]